MKRRMESNQGNYDHFPVMNSILIYRSFHSWSSRSSWRIELPGNEVPELVACSDSMVFAYTSKGYLRSWHVSGIQRSIFSPTNHVVSILANRNTLAVVYEDSLPMNSRVHSLSHYLTISLSHYLTISLLKTHSLTLENSLIHSLSHSLSHSLTLL